MTDHDPSSLHHELRQPLFAIALAAENGAALLASGVSGRSPQIAAKFARILEQVDRAQAILATMTGDPEE